MLIGDSNVNWRWVKAISYSLVIFCEPHCLAGATHGGDWRKKTNPRVGHSATRHTDHRYRFLINHRSEGSRRLLSDVPAKVPAKFSKTNSFWYNPIHLFGCGHSRLDGWGGQYQNRYLRLAARYSHVINISIFAFQGLHSGEFCIIERLRAL